jgi:dTDP-4-amino-4,6-dideoxygalactose transaminase
VHLQPYYRARGFSVGQFAESEKHGNSAITLPLYPTMSEDQQDAVIGALEEVLEG